MTQPPYEPPNQQPSGDDPRQGQPRHGQPDPQGQPGYGQAPPPGYGAPAAPSHPAPPGYGQQGQPGYGHPSQPGYGQPPSYGQQGQQGYGQGYGAQSQPYYGQPGQQGQPSQQGQPGQPAGLKVDLGPRGRLRPEPRAGVSIAAAGAGLLVAGTAIWAGGYLFEGLFQNFFDADGSGPPSTSRKFLGFGLFLVLAAVGYLLMIKRRNGPLASAGAVLAAASVPLALLFVTISIGIGLPVNVDAFFLGSIVVWLASYFFVPGARGRVVFLAAPLLAFPSYIGFKILGSDLTRFAVIRGSGDDSGLPSTVTYGIVGLVFGLAYYAVAFVLDRRGRHGTAVAFVIAGFLTTLGGISSTAPDFEFLGTGILLAVVGVALTSYGGWAGRRFTTWVWAAAFGVGVLLVVFDVASFDSFIAAGVTLMIIGAIVVAAAVAVSSARNEKPDLESPTEPVPAG